MSTVTLPRPAERAAIFSLVLVFLCGAVSGILATNLMKRHGSPPVSSGLTMSVTEMKKGLDLSDEQTQKLTSILDDFSTYYDDLLADGNSRINQILNPDQKRRFADMLKAHRK